MIYVAVTAVALLLIPQDVLAKSDAPFVDVLNHLIGAGGGRWLAFFILVSGLGALNGWTLLVAGSRARSRRTSCCPRRSHRTAVTARRHSRSS